MRHLTDVAHQATAVAGLLLIAALLLCATTWLAVGDAVDPAVQVRHLSLGGFGVLACAAAGALLLTVQVERATEAAEDAAWSQITSTHADPSQGDDHP